MFVRFERMKNGIILLVLLSGFITPIKAQFNEKLEKEIHALNEANMLDGVKKGLPALNLLEDISSEIDSATLATHLLDEPWKYSHSVSNEGRKFRNSTSFYVINFARGEESHLIQNQSRTKVTFEWKYTSKLLQMDFYEKKNFTKSIFWGIHSLSEDRLVISKVIRSKNIPDTSAILFEVYFRR